MLAKNLTQIYFLLISGILLISQSNLVTPGEDVSFFPMMEYHQDPAKGPWIVVSGTNVWGGETFDNSPFYNIYKVIQP